MSKAINNNPLEISYNYKPAFSRKQAVGITVTVVVGLAAIAIGVLALKAMGGADVGIFHALGSMGGISAWILASGGTAAISVIFILNGSKMFNSIKTALYMRQIRKKGIPRRNEELIQGNFKCFSEKIYEAKIEKKFLMIPLEEEGVIIVLTETPTKRSIMLVPCDEETAHHFQNILGDKDFTMYIAKSLEVLAKEEKGEIPVADYTNHSEINK